MSLPSPCSAPFLLYQLVQLNTRRIVAIGTTMHDVLCGFLGCIDRPTLQPSWLAGAQQLAGIQDTAVRHGSLIATLMMRVRQLACQIRGRAIRFRLHPQSVRHSGSADGDHDADRKPLAVKRSSHSTLSRQI